MAETALAGCGGAEQLVTLLFLASAVVQQYHPGCQLLLVANFV